MTTPTTAHRRLVTALACAAALTTLAARPADAQFRKLKDLGKAAVKGAVEGSAEGAAKKAVGADGTAAAKPASVKFTDNLLEITDARIAQFLKGFDAELAARPAAEKQYAQDGAAYESASRVFEARMAEYDRKVEAWNKQSAAHQACAEAVQKKYEGDENRDRAEADRLQSKVESDMEGKQAKMEAMAERLRAAQARGDQATVRAIADSVQREMAGMMGASQQSMAIVGRGQQRQAQIDAEVKKCPVVGEAPKRPEMPGSADAQKAIRLTEEAAAKASGLTAAQYALMKERIETYTHLKGRTGSTQYIYGAGELDVLAKHLDELQQRPELAQPTYWYPGRKG